MLTPRRSLFIELVIWLHAIVLGLLLLRGIVFHEFGFWFLWWNIFLAWLPVGFAWLAVRQKHGWREVLLIGWLLFFPNMVYIITDLIHLILSHTSPIATTYHARLLALSQDTLVVSDVVMIFTAAIIGLFLAGWSLVLLMPLTQKFNRLTHCLMASGLAIVTAFAILLGRIERWNSWDVVTSPFQLSRELLGSLTSLHMLKNIVLYCLIFGPITLILYRIAYLFSKRRV